MNNEQPGRMREAFTSLSTQSRLARAFSIATLERSRSELRGRVPAALAICVGVIYGFLALQVGQMLTFEPTGQRTTSWLVLWGAQQPAWWNYPALLVIFPGGILALPFFGTLVMLLVSGGVGIGMGVGILLTARVIGRRRRELGRPASAGAIAGLTPAMIGLVTLGACCSTTAAATAGIGALAQAGGSNIDTVLANSWYIGVFQLSVLWVALIAQEQLLAVYGVLLGRTPERGRTPSETPNLPRIDRRFAFGAVLRIALIVAGVTWALAGLAQWGFGMATGSAASNTFGWVFSHGVLSAFAVIGGIFPDSLARAITRPGSIAVTATRGALLVGGATQLLWLPAEIASSGWHGLLNELLAVAGAPASWGALSPGSLGATALALRWLLQFLLLGSFTLFAAVDPHRALRPLVYSAARPASPEGFGANPAPRAPTIDAGATSSR